MSRFRARRVSRRAAIALAGAVALWALPVAGTALERESGLSGRSHLGEAPARSVSLPDGVRGAFGERLREGVFKMREGSVDEAIETFEALVRAHPERPEARINLALLDAARWGLTGVHAHLLTDLIDGERAMAEAWWTLRELYSRLIVFAYGQANAIDLALLPPAAPAGLPPIASLRTPFSTKYPLETRADRPGIPDAGGGASGATVGEETVELPRAQADDALGTSPHPALSEPLPGETVNGRKDGSGDTIPNPVVRTAASERSSPRPAGADSNDAKSVEEPPIGLAASAAKSHLPRESSGAAGSSAIVTPRSGEAVPIRNQTGEQSAAAHLDRVMNALSPPPGPSAPAARSDEARAGPASHAPSWRALFKAVGFALGSVVVLGAIAGGIVLLARGRKDGREFRRRLQRVAAPLAGPVTGEARGDEESIFRPAERRSPLSGLWKRIEARYPLLRIRRAAPAAIGAALAGFGGCWFSMWFLQIPIGWWSTPLAAFAGLGAAWYVLAGLQSRQETEFVRQFPEIVDQIVRLSGAGLPPLEAVSAVAADTQDPVKPLLGGVRDGLLAGLDVDSTLRSASERARLGEFTLFAAVIRLQRRAGGGISSAFTNLAETLRERRRTALRAHAATAQSRLTLLVLVLMPIAVLVAQKFIAPQSVEMLFNSDSGLTLLRWGVGLIVGGIFVARKIAARAVR